VRARVFSKRADVLVSRVARDFAAGADDEAPMIAFDPVTGER